MNYHDVARKKLKEHWFKKTKPREEIIKIVEKSKKPLSFNDVVKQSWEQKLDDVTVYRFLHTLEELHLVKKISSLRSYVKCDGWEHLHNHYFLVCNDCHAIDERTIDASESLISSLWIYPDNHCIEIVWKCNKCK